MKDIEFIIGDGDFNAPPTKSFDDEICAFLNEFSSTLIHSKEAKIWTDLAALAFFARRANIQKLKANYTNDRLGRGLCFHIAPSNIPANAIFSYFFGLLAGNLNVVRLPSKEFAQVKFACEMIKKILPKYPQTQQRTHFVKYERGAKFSQEFSKVSDCRMIWGGDATIKAFRAFEVKPRCVDITFADRYSICIINAAKISEASDDEMSRLAANFYNDTYLMDQNACSSPQLIFWLNDSSKSRAKFWDFVYEFAAKKYDLQEALCVDKYAKFCEDSIKFDNVGEFSHKTNLLYKNELKTPKNATNLRGKGGYFYERSLKDMSEIYNIISEKYQTITHFGIDAQNLRDDIIAKKLRGVDRIVPIGKAMDIGVIWDGHDIIAELSRAVNLE